MPNYKPPESFWYKDWSSRTKSYSVHAASRNVLCASEQGYIPWVWNTSHCFIALYDYAGGRIRDIGLRELIAHLELGDRSWAVDRLQVFCWDAEVEWPPDADAMDLYLEQKDQICDSFCRRMGPQVVPANDPMAVRMFGALSAVKRAIGDIFSSRSIDGLKTRLRSVKPGN